MTLEDFFTLTEMKDGLTALSRVHELIAVMQKEKDCIVKNVGDATRQWAAVASTIAATENKDCLDHFIQLDGLWFIDRWLKDAQKYGNDVADGFIEESLAALLRALEKLQIDKERSVSSGIWITITNLLDHSSSRVQDRARALFDSWKQGRASDAVHHDVQSVESFCDTSVITSGKNTEAECAAVDFSLLKGNADAENNAAEPAKDENLQSRSSNCLQPEEVKERIQTRRNVDPSLDHVNMSILSDSVQENLPLKEKFSMNAVEGTALTETPSFSIPKGQNTEPELDASKKLSCSSDSLDAITASSSKVELGVSSAAEATSAKERLTEPAMQNNVDAKEADFCLNSSVSSDIGKSMSSPKAGGEDEGAINHSSKQVFESIAKDDCSPETPPDSSDSDGRMEKPDIGTSFSRMVNIGADEDDREHSSDGVDYLRDDSDFAKTARDTHSSYPMNRKRSDIELEYGIVDALEVARQVAQEVEREVVDSREPSCSSSSDKIMQSDIRQPDSPDSINAKQDLPMDVPQEGMPAGQNQSAEGSPAEERHLSSPNNLETETEYVVNSGAHTEKGLCGFDLNQEVCSDDMERTVNPISAPISVVSASRPAVASGSPSAPLQFEGILGWKGSAATSAFRPASPRKTSDGDKNLEMGGTSNSLKQRQDSLDIDLNVAEDGDEKIMDFLMSGRTMLVSSSLHSGESSLEVGPRRSERPDLDLNRISDEGDAPPLSMRMEGRLFYPRNGHRSPSPASSSSSMQPSLRNFDLNDRPLFHNDSSEQELYHGIQNVSAFGGSKQGDPVISIMGTRVEVGSRTGVGRKDFVPQNPLPNGKPLDPIMDANVARMGGVMGIPTVSYIHSPVFGYNGLTTAPTMSISSAVYGPSIPYMVDARVAPVVPQILSAPSAVPSYSQPAFIMSMPGAPPSLNGAGPSRPNFDLNSGLTNDGGSAGGLRQLFMPGQSRSMEEHLRANAQPSLSSGVGGKRREPDSGWEPYSLPYKHLQPPWR